MSYFIQVDVVEVVPFLFDVEAFRWFIEFLPNFISSWEGLTKEFLERFFSHFKVMKLRNAIKNFKIVNG